MYAVIITGGKQYKVSEGDTLFIEKLDAEAGSEVTFDKVLLVADGEKITAALPMLTALPLRQNSKRTEKAKRSVFSSTKPRKTNVKRSVTDSLIQRLP